MSSSTLSQVQLRPQTERGKPDLVMISLIVGLTALGLIMILSASAPRLEAEGVSRSSQMLRQGLFVLLGSIVFAVASLISDRNWRLLTPWVYGAVLVLLFAVLLGGTIRQGAQRWIALGLFDLQPSEVAKPAVILALAVLLAPVQENKMKWTRIIRAFGLVALPAVLIFLQPDLGTMLVFAFVTVVMLFVSGASLRQLALLALGALVVLVLAVELDLLEDYQVDRLTGFLNPGEQTLTINYNQNQSQIAIASGGMFGQGIGQAPQTNLAFVPSQTTDFIFTAVGEQLGFVGGTLVIVAFAVLVWRTLMISAAARDRFGQLFAVGVGAMIAFHVFVNVGMTVGLLPVTGLPLPFMSFGGSFYLAMMLSLGVVHSVWLHRSRVPTTTTGPGE